MSWTGHSFCSSALLCHAALGRRREGLSWPPQMSWPADLFGASDALRALAAGVGIINGLVSRQATFTARCVA